MMKKWNFKNINTTNTISLGIVLIITASQCVLANGIENLKHQCKSLKPGTEIVIKMTQEELNKHLQWKLKDGCFFEYDPKKKQVIIYKPKKENIACAEAALQDWLDVQDAVDACSDMWVDEDGANVDWSDTKKKAKEVAQKEKQVAQKEKQVAQKEKQVAQKEKQVKELEKMVKAEWYLWYLQDKVILIWKNVDNRNLVLNTLNEILRKLKIRNLKWNEYWEQVWRVLRQVRKVYKIKWDNIIPKKIDTLLKKLNLD